MEKIKFFLLAQFKSLAPSFGIALGLMLFAILLTNLLYQPKKIVKRGFEIAVSTDGKVAEKKEVKSVDIATLLKLANVDKGAKIFKKCATCHTIGKGEAAKIGPNLFGIVGRKKASSAFSYSEAMKAKGGVWDVESLNQFVTKPKDFVSGTKMAFPGLKNPQDRADVILFLERQK